MTDEEFLKLSEDDFIHACWHMPVLGGFAAKIADAYYAADRDNKRTLRYSFSSLFIKGFELYQRAQEERSNV